MNDLERACEHFRHLLKQQQQRLENMCQNRTEFANKETVTLGIIAGDGIGPVIVSQAQRILEKLLAEEVEQGKIVIKEIHGLTIENRLALGQSVPEQVLQQIKSCDVLLKGPTTTPMGGTMESANLKCCARSARPLFPQPKITVFLNPLY